MDPIEPKIGTQLAPCTALTCHPVFLCSRLRAVAVVPPVSSSSGTTSQGSILLIEEYDALAAAISSALRKFAPRHNTVVVRNLAEAKTAAKKIEPALIVIDFDPAFPGLSAFLHKMRDAYPDARVLIIAAKIPGDLAAESRAVGAIQFVDKPFDVPDFGAAVQALLGPWAEAETETLHLSLIHI